jgi:alpha-N-arabinofuranosidase
MANIAQTVNVLQAMILTKEEQMVKTPTFYVFKMYKVHQDALLLPSTVLSEKYRLDNDIIPSLSVSASKSKNGHLNITIANVNPNKDLKTVINFNGLTKIANIKGEIITAGEMNALNDFGKEEQVLIKEFDDFKKKKMSIDVSIPSKSVVLLTIEN